MKVLRIVAAVLGVLVLLVALATAAGVAFVRSERGGDWLRRTIEQKVNGTIAGRVSLARVDIDGWNLAADGLRLTSPDGTPVAQVERVKISVQIWPLLSRRIVISAFEIDRPQITVFAHADGGNSFSDAIATRPSAASDAAVRPAGEDRGFTIDLQRLAIREATIKYLTAGKDEPDEVIAHATGVGLDVKGNMQTVSRSFAAQVSLRGDLQVPLVTPFTLTAAGSGKPDALTAKVRATVDHSWIEIDAHQLASAAFLIERLRAEIHPRLACLGRADCFLLEPVTLSGRARIDKAATSDLAIDLGGAGGTLKAQARFNLKERTLAQLTIDGTDLDLGRMLTAAPRSRFSMRAEASGQWKASARENGFTGKAAIEIPPGRLAGRPFGPVNATLAADAPDRARFELAAVLPGARLAAAGRRNGEQIAADGRLKLTSLAALTRALGIEISGGPATGSGDLGFRVSGNQNRMRLLLDGRFAHLTGAGVAVSQMVLSADAPALPDPRGARLDLRIGDLRFGSQRFGATRLRVAPGARADQVSLAASISRPEPLSLAVLARMPKPRNFIFDSVQVDYPDARWRSTGAMRLALQEGVLRIEGMALANGDQTLSLDALQTPATRQIGLAIAQLDLRHLPRIVRGDRSPASGRIDLQLQLAGTKRRPTLNLKLLGRGLMIDKRRLGDIDVQASDTRQDPLRAELVWRGGAAPMTVSVQTPFHLGDLMNRPWPAVLDRALTTRQPFTLHAGLEKFPLRALDVLTGKRHGLSGDLSMTGDLSGPLMSLQGALVLAGRGLATKGVPATDVDLDLRAQPTQLTTRLSVRRRNTVLLTATGRLARPAGARPKAQDLWNSALTLDAQLAPIRVQRLGLVPKDRKQAPRSLHGMVSARLNVKGTAAKPIIDISARTDNLSLEKQRLGTVKLHGLWQDTTARLDVEAASSENGQLRASFANDFGMDLRALVAAPPPPAQWPWQAKFSADRFDVGWLSGLIPDLPTVAGRISANLSGRGPAAKMDWQGRLDVRDASATVIGLGLFESIKLSVEGDRKSLRLKELYVRSGAGSAKMDAWMGDGAGQQRALAANLSMKDFLLRSEGQKVGTLSLQAALKGTLASTDLTLQTTFKEAHFRVASGQRRSLQPLQEPADLVLVSNDKPLNKHQARKLAALNPTDPQAGPAAHTSAALRIQTRVKGPRNLWVHADDANLELGLSDDFRVMTEDGAPRVFGSVLVRRGDVSVLRRKFRLDPDSRVTFSGSPEEPRLDVKARHENKSAGVTVFVSLTGSKTEPVLTLTSQPPHSQTALIMLLLTGRMDLDQPAGPSSSGVDKVASLLGSMLASKLQKTLAKRLPLDVLTIEPGQGAASASLEAGTYLTNKVYVAYVGRLAADPTRQQNRNSVHLEYQLTPRWSFEGEYGDARKGSADVVWKKHY